MGTEDGKALAHSYARQLRQQADNLARLAATVELDAGITPAPDGRKENKCLTVGDIMNVCKVAHICISCMGRNLVWGPRASYLNEIKRLGSQEVTSIGINSVGYLQIEIRYEADTVTTG